MHTIVLPLHRLLMEKVEFPCKLLCKWVLYSCVIGYIIIDSLLMNMCIIVLSVYRFYVVESWREGMNGD